MVLAFWQQFVCLYVWGRASRLISAEGVADLARFALDRSGGGTQVELNAVCWGRGRYALGPAVQEIVGLALIAVVL